MATVALFAPALVGCTSTADPGPTLDPTMASVPAPDALRQVRERVAELVASNEVPSVAVAVVSGGEIVWEEGFGWADVEAEVPATASIPYSLASISKPITATGLMSLVERGLIDLDAPVNDYLGERGVRARVGSADDATVRRVANHTAGLPLHYQFFWADRDIRRPPMPVTIGRWGNLATAPGERYRYSNLGYGILDHVIERVSGKEYPRFLAQEVLAPLGMAASSVPLPPGPGVPHARRYGPDRDPLPFYDFDHRGASAVFSSAHDLALFALFHLKRRQPGQEGILAAEAIDEMQRGTAEAGEGTAYGIGWMIQTRFDGHRVVGHTGGMAGVTTSLLLVPQEEVAVVVLMNARGPWPSRFSDAILERLLRRPPIPRRPDSTGRTGGGTSERRPADGLEPLVGRWEGEVDDPEGPVVASLQVDGDGTGRLRLDGGPWLELRQPRLRDGFFEALTLPGHDREVPRATPRILRLDVKLRGDVLNGSLTAITRPHDRTGSALSSWIELQRDD